jgi:hypothetical protein
MNVLTCAEVLDRLEGFHDEELSVCDQIAVSAHLGWCRECADEFAQIQLVGLSLRASAPGRAVLAGTDEVVLRSSVVNRANAEKAASFAVQVRHSFEDMHFVYAGLGAAMAAVVCAIIMIGTMQLVANEQPDSLAAIVRVLASPGSNQNPVSLGRLVRMPRPLDEGFSAEANTDLSDTIFTLAAVVTREGRVANLELLRASGTPATMAGVDGAKALQDLLGAASRAHFEPARVAGSPVAVSMVWIVAHTTVKGTQASLSLPTPRVTAKKRIAGHEVPAPRSTRA